MTPTRPRISAILPTHNRAAFLEKALASLAEQSLPPEEFEVVVVDNASTDRTVEVIRSWQAKLPNLRPIYEGRLGLQWARNRGAEASAAPYIAYLDDDARADPRWLACLLDVFEKATPNPACVGGRVWLDWKDEPPSWLPDRFFSLYTYVDHGDEDRLLGEREYLVGANFAFARSALLDSGGFEPSLDRRGTLLLSGGDSEIVNRMRAQGLPVYYSGRAVVWHAVTPERLQKRWFWRRMFWDGASQPLVDWGTGRARTHYLRQAYRDVRRTGYFALRLLFGRRAQRFENRAALVQRLGRLYMHWLLTCGKVR